MRVADASMHTVSRLMHLHTLLHGRILIEVEDKICVCGSMVWYDCLTDGVACASRYNAFTRELLDSWMFDVCGAGLMFRESFASWKRKTHAVSIRDSIIDDPTVLQRRMANGAFSMYLKLLQFPTDDVLRKIFSCKTCQTSLEDGTTRWEAVVIDETATGILNKLPGFERPTQVLLFMNKTSHLQFLLLTKVHRDFLDAIFVAAKRNEGRIEYNVEYLKSVQQHADGLILFFMRTCTSHHAEENVEADRCFITRCLGVNGGRFTHKIMDLDVRRNCIEFAQCFVTGCIAGGVLRSQKSSNAAKEFVVSTEAFLRCNNEVDTVPCANCTRRYHDPSLLVNDDIPAASLLVSSVANASLFAVMERSVLREIAKNPAEVVRFSQLVRTFYLHEFYVNVSPSVKSVKQEHEHGNNFGVVIYEN